ncbi:trafficking protein particle complex subunit [Anaeramoeba flamelloides]|uniref:Trafficking protein particle complex subunit n=1 Tax=Anaeramoeba flamelloides TaxID=1746091 RepID=A0AAV7ZDI0_9EUKA|nr:trafficking protein particle complex subunit [Anaeramoeba flamelloides]
MELINFSKTLDPTQNLDDPSFIKVSIVPVGLISTNSFNYFSWLIKSITSVKFQDLPLQSNMNKNSKGSKNIQQGWNKGKVNIRYLEGKPIENDYRHFQPHKSIKGVIGIADAQSGLTLDQIGQSLGINNKTVKKKNGKKKNSKGLQREQITRCLIFNSNENQINDLFESSNKNSKKSGKSKGKSKSKSKSRGKSVLTEEVKGILKKSIFPISEETIEVEMAITAMVAIIVDNLCEIATTPIDKDLKFSLPNENQDSKNFEKYLEGRYWKCIADHCLLAGLLEDSRIHYIQSISYTSSNSDSVYYANTLENLICIDILQELYQNPDLKKVIIQKYKEILRIYMKKKNQILKIEGIIKYTKFLFNQNDQECKKLGLEALSKCLSNLPELKVEEQILLYTNLASLYEMIGFKRKVSFFLWKTAYLYKKNQNYQLFHNFLLCSCRTFNLEMLLEKSNYQDKKKKKGFIKKKEYLKMINREDIKPTDWTNLKVSILLDLIEASHKINEYLKFIYYILYLLQYFREFFSVKLQNNLMASLIQASEHLPLKTNINYVKFPTIVEVDLVPLSKDVVPNKLKNDDQTNDVFIFSPFSKKKSKVPQTIIYPWTKTQNINVSVIFSNPFEFEIKIDRLSFKTTSKSFNSFPMSLIIPPRTKKFKCVLSGKAKKIDDLFEISKIVIEISHLKFQHSVKLLKKIRIVESLPLLKITRVGQPIINSYEGECIESQLIFENIGLEPITKIFIDSEERHRKQIVPDYNTIYNKYYVHKIVEWNAKVIQLQLPLNAGESFVLPLKWCTKLEIKKCTLVIKYYGRDTHNVNPKKLVEPKKKTNNFFRICKIPYHINCISGISFKYLSIIKPSSSILLKRYKINNNFQNYLIILELKNYSKIPFIINTKILKQKIISSNEKFKENNSDSANLFDPLKGSSSINNYNFNEENSIYESKIKINKFDKKPKKAILNEFHTTIQIEKLEEKRLFVPIQNLCVPKEYLSVIPYDECIEDFIQREHWIPENQQAKRLSQIVSLKSLLLERISINWKTENRRRGVVFFHTLQITKNDFQLLEGSQLYLNFITLPKYSLHQLQLITLKIHNQKNEKITTNLQIQIFYNGNIINQNILNNHPQNLKKNKKEINNKNNDNENKIFWMGYLSKSDIQIDSNRIFTHQFHVSFLERGKYDFKAICKNTHSNKQFEVFENLIIEF